jgi:hypothetical protein
MRLRKLNRRSGPARVTQKGTSKSYPQPDHRALTRKQSRYSGTGINGTRS